MNCHACEAPMTLDRWGHPVHDGPCPGYPPANECPHCLTSFARPLDFARHRSGSCTADNPKPPGRHRCPVCSLPHPYPCDYGRRWPTQPLEDHLIARLGGRRAQGRFASEAEGSGYTAWRGAELLGIEARNWLRYKALGHMGERSADLFATRLGLHPSAIWGWAWFDAALRPGDRRFLAEGWRPAWEWNEAHKTQATTEVAA